MVALRSGPFLQLAVRLPMRRGAIDLQVPVVLCLENVVSADGGEGLVAAGVTFPDPHTMLYKEASREHPRGWVVELNGQFREFEPRGKRREWARPFSFLWRFTQSEFSVSDPRPMSVRELRSRLTGLVDPFEEAPIAENLRTYLDGLPGDEVVSEEMLLGWPI